MKFPAEKFQRARRIIDRPRKRAFHRHPNGDTNVETVVTLRFKGLPNGTRELTLTHECLRNNQEMEDHTYGRTGCLGCLGTFTHSEGNQK